MNSGYQSLYDDGDGLGIHCWTVLYFVTVTIVNKERLVFVLLSMVVSDDDDLWLLS
jgi:hypothetical protein